MLAALDRFVATATQGNNTHFLLIQALLTVVGLVVVAVILWAGRKIAQRIDNANADAAETKDKVNQLFDIMVTKEPTPLDPHPRKGVVDVVADHTKSLGALLDGTKELVADKAVNDGSSSRDALIRIEKEQVRVAENLAHEGEDA